MNLDVDRLKAALADRYAIERELGHGGMATVYLAADLKHDRPVALKVMRPELAVALGRERFLREIRVAAGLQHPNVVAVHDSGEADGMLYYVMPFVEGETLRARLQRDERLPIDDALRIAQDVAAALGHAHGRGIIHRDVKPENILLSATGHALVTDFGIARAAELALEDRLTATGASVGTAAYMAPEQALGETVDARADVWALGCVVYEMLAGEPPFGREQRQALTRSVTAVAPPLREHRSDAPRSVEQAVHRALARVVEERFASAAGFGAALVAEDVGRKRSARRRNAKFVTALERVGFRGVALIFVLAIATLLWKVGRPGAGTGRASRSAIGRSPDSLANELYRQARGLQTRRTLEDQTRGLDLFSTAIARDSSFARAWAGLARTAQLAYIRGFAVHGMPMDSLLAIGVRASRRAVDLAPRDPESWIASARVAQIVEPGGRSSAITSIRRALALDSTSVESAESWFELGLAYQEMLKDSLAEVAWHRAIRLDPENAQALGFLALHYHWVGEPERALPFADSAVAIDGTNVVAREAAWQVAFDLGRVDRAAEQVAALQRSALGHFQEFAVAGQARVQLARGDTAGARATLAEAVQAFDVNAPSKHQALYIGGAFAALGDTAEAVRLMLAYQPREDLHFQLHAKRDPWLRWTHGPRGKGILTPDPS